MVLNGINPNEQPLHVVVRLSAGANPVETRSAETQTENVLAQTILTSHSASSSQPKWVGRALHSLDSATVSLNKHFPNNIVQRKIDALAGKIEAKFKIFTKFNEWLDSNGHGKWYVQLATFLVKLPFRAVRNILNLLYAIIKTSLQAIVHPIESILKLARLLVNLAHQLTRPETWTVFGAAMLGTSFGQALVTGNPLSLLTIGIGAGFMLGGITAGAIKAAIQAKPGHKVAAVKANLLSQAKMIPEATVTGLLMGLCVGSFERIQQLKEANKPVTNHPEAFRWARQRQLHEGLPDYVKAWSDKNHTVSMQFSPADVAKVRNHPNFSPYHGDRLTFVPKPDYLMWNKPVVARLHAAQCATVATAAHMVRV